MRHGTGPALVAAGLIAAASPAHAQSVTGGFEAASDEVRAGISWSGGKAAASADARIDAGPFDAALRLVTLRGSARHAGADLVADITVGRDWSIGAVTLRTEATGHVFAGATLTMNFAEVAVGARYGIGPLRVGATAWYAPRQGAIGGDNLHVRAMVDAGLPGLPISVFASAGYTTGSGTDSRSQRLRPAGDYADWKIGAEYSRYPLIFGLDYVGTDRGALRTASSAPFGASADAGDRFVARLRFSF